jgi:dynein heavy chain
VTLPSWNAAILVYWVHFAWHAKTAAILSITISTPACLPGPLLPLQVALSLIQSEVVVVPSTGEVSTALSRLVHNLAESGKPFVRWMDGTCIEAPEQ